MSSCNNSDNDSNRKEFESNANTRKTDKDRILAANNRDGTTTNNRNTTGGMER